MNILLGALILNTDTQGKKIESSKLPLSQDSPSGRRSLLLYCSHQPFWRDGEWSLRRRKKKKYWGSRERSYRSADNFITWWPGLLREQCFWKPREKVDSRLQFIYCKGEEPQGGQDSTDSFFFFFFCFPTLPPSWVDLCRASQRMELFAQWAAVSGPKSAPPPTPPTPLSTAAVMNEPGVSPGCIEIYCITAVQ